MLRNSSYLNVLWQHKLFLVFLFFLVSRLIIIFVYAPYITDVSFYYEVAAGGIHKDLTAYKDFFFPYPPLALLFVYTPIYFGNTLEEYRLAFQIQMFLIDGLCLILTVMFMRKRFGFSDDKIAYSIIIYSILGLLVGHLLYDRLDLLNALVFVAIVYFITGNRLNRPMIYTVALLGTLIKLLPIFWLPLIATIDIYQGKSCQDFMLRKLLPLIFVYVVPLTVFILIYDSSVDGGLSKFLLQHSNRGIQVESTWAIPIYIFKGIFGESGIHVVNNYGAQHLAGVSALYVSVSKYSGFTLLSLLFSYFFLLYRQKVLLNPVSHLPVEIIFLMLFSITVFLLASQRVLSPQYFIWLIPGISIFAFEHPPRYFLLLCLLIFGLTYVGFDLGYWKFVKGDPFFIFVVAIRNLLLIGLAVALIQSVIYRCTE